MMLYTSKMASAVHCIAPYRIVKSVNLQATIHTASRQPSWTCKLLTNKSSCLWPLARSQNLVSIRCVQHNLHQAASRQFTTSSHKCTNRLPFEVNSNVKKDTPIFSYSNDRIYRMMTIFGIVQFFFWGNLAVFAYSTLKQFKAVEHNFKEGSFHGQVVQVLSKYNYKIAALCALLGHVVLGFTFIYPLRTITKIVLLRGGNKVRLTTYTHFGKTRSFVVPTDHISSQQSRSAVVPQVSLKIKGTWMYFLMDKRDGVFHNPQLFDYVVGLKRDWK